MPADALDNNHLRPAHILLIDDDPRLLDSLRRLLTVYGHRVDVALGGAEAIARLGDARYDLLLLDLRMPHISGHDVMRHMANNGIDVMTIVVSGETSLDDISHALRNGAYDYLKKPYVPEELLATVNNAIRKRRLEDYNQVIQQRLNRSERLHRFIVNNSADIIYILDENGRFSFINGQVENLLGYAPTELLGRHITHIVEAEELEKARYFFGRAWTQQDGRRTIEIALKPCRATRSRRHFELTMWPIADNDDLDVPGQRYRTYGTARDVTDRRQAEALISFQAYHDLLTRLPNRVLFKDRLKVAVAQAGRNGQRPAVMFIDLDRFKVINDSLGHSMGDRLLQAVSRRLEDCVRRGDTLSRFGGDEFTLLLPDAQNTEVVSQVAEKILESLKAPFTVDGHDLYVGASIGIAIYPDGGTNIDALIKNADIAMYRVKNSGKDDFQIFSQEMNAGMSQRLLLEQELRRGMESGELEICYQPQIDSETAQLVGVEALIRWNHPRLGQIPPSVFIPIAEDSRLILEMDRLTLQRACREIGDMHRQGWPMLRLSVNLSPLLVERDNFVDSVLAILEEEAFPPECLELEITENLLLSDRPDVIDKLLRLYAAGVRFAIDDFGTGYSSLSYLQKFPISTLKIDRRFIHNIGSSSDACIVNAIVAMAQGLKLRVIAEGVENGDQLAYLRSIQCPVVQGFLFGAARPLAELRDRYRGGAVALYQDVSAV
jgi:diguanylate cyclase (GGDEF)-like protein/PAS domain S-box-containing protein